jgi:hypothetical protein
MVGGCLLALVAFACTTPDETETSVTTLAGQGSDRCGFAAGAAVAWRQGIPVRSNGADTGTSSGALAYQCVAFAKRLAFDVLHDSLSWTWGTAARALRDLPAGKALLGGRNGYFRLGPAVSPDGSTVLDELTPTTGFTAGEPPREDDLLIYWPRDTGRASTVYDDQPSGGQTAGHVATVANVHRDASDRVIGLDLVEQNVVTDAQCSTDGWATRYVSVTYDSVYGYRVSPGDGVGNMIVAGWLRHDLTGLYPDGWHEDGTSDALRAAYDRAGKYVGWSCDHGGGGPFAHRWQGMVVQDLCQPCALLDKSACGGSRSVLALGPQTTDGRQVAYRIAWGFRGYLLMQPEQLHRPLSDEIPLANGRACQVFELGYLYWNGLGVIKTGSRPDPACVPQDHYARSATTQLPNDVADEGVGGGADMPPPAPPPPPAPVERTIACDDSGTDLLITVTAPITDSLVGGPPVQSTLVTIVGDQSAWLPGAGISSLTLQPDYDTDGQPHRYTFHAPLDLGRFNVYAFGGSEARWGDLPDVDGDGNHFSVTGACAMTCDAIGCAAQRSTQIHAAQIDCQRTTSVMHVTVSGPIGINLVGGNGTNPSAITWGGDAPPGWTDDTGKSTALWTGDGGPYVIDVPAGPGLFNLKVITADGPRWADLPDADGNGTAFVVSGACRVRCDSNACALAME